MKPNTLSEASRIAAFCAAAVFAETLLTGCGKSAADEERERVQKQMIEETRKMEESKKNSFMDKGLPPIVWPDKFSDNFKTSDGKAPPASNAAATTPTPASTQAPTPTAVPAPATPDPAKRAP
jgi:hypothetical protein